MAEVSEFEKRTYRTPQTEIVGLTTEALHYLTEVRMLTQEVLDEYRLGCNRYGEICIPFYNEDNELCLVKKRHPTGGLLQRQRRSKDDPNKWEQYECKTDCERGGRPVLLGSHFANPDLGPLVICFGDYDAMAVAVDGVPNCVSPPFGDKSFKFVDEQWEFLEKFNEIIIYPDIDANPKTRKQVEAKVVELAKRLGMHKCKTVVEKYRYGTKDANELLQQKGVGHNKYLINHAEFIHEPGLERLADYQEVAVKEGITTGFSDIDRATGGLSGSQLTIVSGDNNAGKTTVILNLIKEAVRQRQGVFYWSGEQKPDRIRWWLEQIMAGPEFVDSQVSRRTGREYWFAKNEFIQRIRAWYRDYVYVLDKRGLDAEEFFKTAELVVRRHNVKLVIVDNLMAFTGSEENYFQAQGAFAESGKMFAENWDVHFLIIAHNKKIDADAIPDKDAVEGSKKVTNWADFVIQCIRTTAAMKQKPDFNGADGVLYLCKNRETETLEMVRTLFEPKSKRLVQMTEVDKTRERVGWEPIDDSVNQVLVIHGDDDDGVGF